MTIYVVLGQFLISISDNNRKFFGYFNEDLPKGTSQRKHPVRLNLILINELQIAVCPVIYSLTGASTVSATDLLFVVYFLFQPFSSLSRPDIYRPIYNSLAQMAVYP